MFELAYQWFSHEIGQLLLYCRGANEHTSYKKSLGLCQFVIDQTDIQGYLYYHTWKNRKFWMENQMVSAILFWKVKKIWAVIWDDAILYFF